MTRAGIFIGVDKTGKLQKLNDAAIGAKKMYNWACSQGVNAKLITDEGGAKVKPDMILESIQEILNGPGADQLILYFAGHGVNINRGEQWLLTDAPTNPNAAEAPDHLRNTPVLRSEDVHRVLRVLEQCERLAVLVHLYADGCAIAEQFQWPLMIEELHAFVPFHALLARQPLVLRDLDSRTAPQERVYAEA